MSTTDLPVKPAVAPVRQASDPIVDILRLCVIWHPGCQHGDLQPPVQPSCSPGPTRLWRSLTYLKLQPMRRSQ